MLVSWNFVHIVRFNKIRSFNAVNLEYGYKWSLFISPLPRESFLVLARHGSIV